MNNEDYDFDAICAQLAQEERDLEALWEEKMKDYHDFDNSLDDEVTRCNKCGMNVLGDFSKCADYIAYNEERNRKLREAAGL